MTTRPAISEAVRRAVLLEARDHCAVCCHPLTLELAHIVPWRETKDHSAENLIALCPNCHSMADRNGWKPAHFKYYKENPCALAGKMMPPMSPTQRILIETILAADPDDLSESERRRLVDMLAAYLGVKPKQIDIVTVKPTNSSRVLLRLSVKAADRLIAGWEDRDPRLFDLMSRFGIQRVQYRETRSGDDVYEAALRLDSGFPSRTDGRFSDQTIGLLTPGSEDEFPVYVGDDPASRDPAWQDGRREAYGRLRYHMDRNRVRGAITWKLPFDPIETRIELQVRLVGERGQTLQMSRKFVARLSPFGSMEFNLPLGKYVRRHIADVAATLKLRR